MRDNIRPITTGYFGVNCDGDLQIVKAKNRVHALNVATYLYGRGNVEMNDTYQPTDVLYYVEHGLVLNDDGQLNDLEITGGYPEEYGRNETDG